MIMKIFEDRDFIKSSYSGYGSNSGTSCVLVAKTDSIVAVRDSKDPQKNTLEFTVSEWRAFIAGIKAGEFDL